MFYHCNIEGLGLGGGLHCLSALASSKLPMYLCPDIEDTIFVVICDNLIFLTLARLVFTQIWFIWYSL